MHIISHDTPALYLTSVANARLPVFRTDDIKRVACSALSEARRSAGFALYAYVLMPDHLHVITDVVLKPSKVLQYINGIISRRVIDHLKEHGHNASLQKLRHETRERQYRYSLWDHHNNLFSITSEDMFMQKINYIHQNPVRAGLVEKAEHYLWSSVRWWKGSPREDEPLEIDINRIAWRGGVASSKTRRR
jgi:REP element-mobilizing transposase RayT